MSDRPSDAPVLCAGSDDGAVAHASPALALQLREAQLRGIFDAASEGILTVDESQVVVMANRAAADIFRCRVEDLVGAPLERLVPAQLRERHRADVARFGASESPPRRMGGRGLVMGLRADGAEFPLEAGISQAHVDGLRLYTVILRDLSQPQGAAAALRTSEQLLAATFDSSSVGMAHIDPRTHRFLAVNATFCRMTGFSQAELLAMDPDHLDHPDDRVDPARFSTLLAGDAPDLVEKRLLRRDGGHLWVSVAGSVVRDAAGRPLSVVGIVQDVTERRQVQDDLRARAARQSLRVRLNDHLRPLDDPQAIAFEASRLLGEFVGAARVGYAEDDGNGETVTLVKNYTDGVAAIEGRYRYDDYGPALLQAFRAGRTVVRPDIANDPTLTPAEKAAHAALQLGATVNIPLLKAGRLHAVFFVHASTARDWTPDEVALFEEVAERIRADVERARAEAEGRATKAKLQATLASMNDSVVVTDQHGRLVDFNDAFVTFHRVGRRSDCPTTVEGWLGLIDILLPDGTPAPFEQLPVPRALRGEQGSNVELMLRRKDTGETWSASYSFAPIRSEDGRLVGTVVTGRDMTELNRMHAELKASHDQLQQLVAAQDHVQEQERLRIARELHDELQQGLATILMQAGNAAAALGQADHPAARALARIERVALDEIVATRRLIRDLRPQMLEELGLVAALESLTAQFAERSGLTCRFDHSALDPMDEPQLVPLATCLYRVTQEALNNVAKHAGTCAVEVTLARRADGQLLLTVADDGAGMADAAQRRDAFGLIGMRERVRAAGGTLRVHDTPGGGTTIEVEVPGDHADPPRPA